MKAPLVEIVREQIVSGAIAPDAPIRQDALAARLKVSKIPLREALARLEQDGLVVSQSNRGFFVRPMSAGEAEEIFALRLKLEPEAAAEGARRAREGDHRAARAALAAFEKDAAAGRARVGMRNRAFHLALVSPCGKPVTIELVARLHVLADRYVRMHLEPKGRSANAEAEHHALMDAWLARDGRRVAQIAAAHLEHTRADLMAELAR